MVRILADIDWDNVPEEFSDPEKARQLRDSLIFGTQTVGPKAPPQNFVPIEFLNYIIALLHDSRQLGWVKVDGVHQSLLAKVLEAKRALEKGQTKVAKNALNAFLNEVQAASCPEFACPGNKPLTSEGYALLFFKGSSLWSGCRAHRPDTIGALDGHISIGAPDNGLRARGHDPS